MTDYRKLLGDLATLDVMDDRPKCKGLFFRGRRSFFATDGGYGVREQMRLLKRKSCQCEACQELFSHFKDDLREGLEPLVPLAGIEDGKLYTLVFKPGMPDWETGVVEDWEWAFIAAKENDDA